MLIDRLSIDMQETAYTMIERKNISLQTAETELRNHEIIFNSIYSYPHQRIRSQKYIEIYKAVIEILSR